MIIGSGVIGLCVLFGACAIASSRFASKAPARLLGLDCARRARAHHAGLHRDRARPGVYEVAARLRRDLLVLAVVRVRVLPNDSPSRLFPAPGRRRRARACTAADGCDGHCRSFVLLLVGLVAVIGLAKAISPTIEAAVHAFGAPRAAIGIAVALIVLLPESIAAIRAALANRLQTSLNLALGSALATIGLTVPIVVGVCLWFDIPLVLGLEAKDIVLLALTSARRHHRRGGRPHQSHVRRRADRHFRRLPVSRPRAIARSRPRRHVGRARILLAPSLDVSKGDARCGHEDRSAATPAWAA